MRSGTFLVELETLEGPAQSKIKELRVATRREGAAGFHWGSKMTEHENQTQTPEENVSGSRPNYLFWANLKEWGILEATYLLADQDLHNKKYPDEKTQGRD